MAGVALRSRGNMGRWILSNRFLRYIGATVTRRALTGSAGVIHGRRRERNGIRMTRVAGGTGGDVRQRLGARKNRRVGTVMTGHASPGRARVVHRRRLKHLGVVAGIALPCIRYVSGVLPFRASEEISAIVAACALANDVPNGVVHDRRREAGEVIVATVALRGGGDMGCRLG